MPASYFSSKKLTSLSQLIPGDRVHFIGIGGIAMGQLALLTNALGYTVSGSDKELYDPMATLLRHAAITCTLGYQACQIAPDTSLVVIGNAIAANNPELLEVAARGIAYATVSSLTQDLIVRDTRATLVCGTHGKTTTCAMICTTLDARRSNPSYFFGGIRCNSSLGIQQGTSPYCILEGDEYFDAFFVKEAKLLQYAPHACILTGIEHDHIDIYPDLSSYCSVFDKLVTSLPVDGFALCNIDCPNISQLCSEWRKTANCKIYTFGCHPEADFKLLSRHGLPHSQQLTIQHGTDEPVAFTIPCIGAHNAQNALAAVASAQLLASASLAEAAAGLCNFVAVHKRQELLFQQGGVSVIEDFAYHPTAIARTLAAIQESRPGARIIAVHEPVSPTARRALFQDAYREAFLNAGKVILCRPTPSLIDRGHTRLEIDHLAASLTELGVPALVLDSAVSIVQYIIDTAEENDTIVVFSHTAFANLPQTLARRFAQAFANDDK